MAKAPTDYSTIDFVPHEMNVTCSKVLMDRQRHIASVAKRGKSSAHLQVKSGVLKLARYTSKELAAHWSDADYPFECAVAKLLELEKQHGITDAVCWMSCPGRGANPNSASCSNGLSEATLNGVCQYSWKSWLNQLLADGSKVLLA